MFEILSLSDLSIISAMYGGESHKQICIPVCQGAHIGAIGAIGTIGAARTIVSMARGR